MMRTPNAYAIAVRKADGTIVNTAAPLPKWSDKYPLLKLPVLRGGAVLVQSMGLGIKALNYSANEAFAEAEEANLLWREAGMLLSKRCETLLHGFRIHTDNGANDEVKRQSRIGVELAEQIKSLNALGLTVLLIEHKLDVVTTLADTVYVLDHGEVIAHGRPEEVRRNEEVLRAYLGRNAQASLAGTSVNAA